MIMIDILFLLIYCFWEFPEIVWSVMNCRQTILSSLGNLEFL